MRNCYWLVYHMRLEMDVAMILIPGRFKSHFVEHAVRRNALHCMLNKMTFKPYMTRHIKRSGNYELDLSSTRMV